MTGCGPGVDRVSAALLDEGVEIVGPETKELADLEVADPTLEHETVR